MAALAALAQETRLAIYRLLVEAGPTGLAVGEIGASVKAAPATLSFHLKELVNAGLLSSRQDGRYIFYSANYPHMNALIAFLTDQLLRARRRLPSVRRAPLRRSLQRSKS